MFWLLSRFLEMLFLNSKIAIRFFPAPSPTFLLYRSNASMTIPYFSDESPFLLVTSWSIGWLPSSSRSIHMRSSWSVSQILSLSVIRRFIMAKNSMECYLWDWNLMCNRKDSLVTKVPKILNISFHFRIEGLKKIS